MKMKIDIDMEIKNQNFEIVKNCSKREEMFLLNFAPPPEISVVHPRHNFFCLEHWFQDGRIFIIEKSRAPLLI